MQVTDIRFNSKEADLFLKEYFSYYNTLDETWQAIFVERLLYFAQTKNFVAKKGFEINNKVKAIVSASAVQLTLGLHEWQMKYFNTILLFPTDFFNQAGLGLKGETHLAGFMSFSWTSFIQGYKVTNDNLNLGLHEFTHALRFNSVRGEESDYFFENYFPKWYNYAKQEYSRIRAGKQSIFRKYGGANINEFLSVVVEHFFESPIQFEKEHPLLYSATAILLNQRTDGKKTAVNVRESELEKTRSNDGFSANIPEPAFLKNNSTLASLLFFITALLSLFRSDISSFPVLFLLSLSVFYYLLFDYRYCRAVVRGETLELFSGYWLFKNRKRYTIYPHKLTRAEIFSTGTNEQTISFTFFDETYFFQDVSVRAGLKKEDQHKLVVELEKNHVWVLEHL
jgi:Mlc titration factor MtfA (ptsG expression regulator)